MPLASPLHEFISSGGTVIYYNEVTKTPPVKDNLITEKNELTDMIAVVHPSFRNFSDEAKERAVEFILEMNPYIHAVAISEVIDGKKVTKASYKAEKGKPVLIPLIKFIAE